MTPADEARANALPCEMVKYALRQTKDGIVVSFVVHPNDIPAALQTSHIGSRWMAALVQIGDDEKPIHQPAKESDASPQPSPQVKAGAKRDWRELQPQQQAGIRADDAVFTAFLREEYPDIWHDAGEPAQCIRDICGVQSRSAFGTNHKARMLWHSLDEKFQAWSISQ